MDPLKKAYSKVNIEIGNVCNLQCSFCPEVLRSKKLMTPEFFEKVIEQVAPLTEMVCLHLMGDPLVHPQLAEMMAICEKHQVRIFFVTNGVLLREDKIPLLLSPSLHQVSFSLHSFSDNFPDRDPSEYLERVFRFTERALSERADLYVNFRLWNLLAVTGSGFQNEEFLRRISQRFDFVLPPRLDVRLRKGVRIRGRLYLHFDTEFQWPSLDLPVLGTSGRCHGLSSHFGILADGTVVPCCLDKEGLIPLGKIGERPLLEILGGTRAKDMLRGFRQRKLIERLCQRCQYIERFNEQSTSP